MWGCGLMVPCLGVHTQIEIGYLFARGARLALLADRPLRELALCAFETAPRAVGTVEALAARLTLDPGARRERDAAGADLGIEPLEKLPPLLRAAVAFFILGHVVLPRADRLRDALLEPGQRVLILAALSTPAEISCKVSCTVVEL